MKIAIDYTYAEKHIGGMGVFTKNIVNALDKIDQKNKYVLISNPLKFDSSNLVSKIFSALKEHLWYQTELLIKLNSIKSDIYYAPNPPVPYLLNIPIILTIPDMAFYYEKSIPLLVRMFLFINYFFAAKKAKKITTISKHSKKDIQKILKVNPDKVIVIPLAASKDFQPVTNKKAIAKTLSQHNIKKPFILCTPGTFLPRKNVKDLVKAVHNLDPAIKYSISIVLVGVNQGLYFEKLKKCIKKLKMLNQVIFTGYIDNIQLVNLYSAAKLFVYPSLYEGFGLPPLEAMACGTPVIVYNKTSLPEVVGNSGLLVNDNYELTEAITKVLSNKKLYNKLSNKGLERSKTFSWSKSAMMYKQVFEKVKTN